MVCFHPILTWTKADDLASKKYYPLSLNCLARCRAKFCALYPATGVLVDAVFPTASMLRDGSERRSFDRQVTKARRRLGSGAFGAGWEEGIKMPIDRAIAE